jgi:hypothetical protein
MCGSSKLVLNILLGEVITCGKGSMVWDLSTGFTSCGGEGGEDGASVGKGATRFTSCGGEGEEDGASVGKGARMGSAV